MRFGIKRRTGISGRLWWIFEPRHWKHIEESRLRGTDRFAPSTCET